MDLYHLLEIYQTNTGEKLMDTATKAGLDNGKTTSKNSQEIKYLMKTEAKICL